MAVLDEIREIPTDEIVTFSLVDHGSPSGSEPALELAGRDGVLLELSGGDRVLGRLTDGSGDPVIMETQAWGRLVLAMDRVVSIRFPSSATSAHVEALNWFQSQPNMADDRILLTNGDVVTGFIVALDRNAIRLESGGETQSIPLRLAVAARLVHAAPAPRRGIHAAITLKDGQRMTVVEMNWESDKINARRGTEETVEPRCELIRTVEVSGGRWTWLSEVDPSVEEHKPMLSFEWRHQRNANVLGGPLRVAGVRYKQGFGVHSRSILVFDLNGQYETFVTALGMDDHSGPFADVNVMIMVDGKGRYEKSGIRAGSLHGPVRLDLDGAKRLELHVDFGLNGDMQDRFNWIEPGLVKPGAKSEGP